MSEQYSIEDARPSEACYMCGEPATICIVADTKEYGTGYRDEVPLCELCAEKRGV